VWAVKSLSSMVSANRAVAGGRMDGSVVLSAARDRERRSVIEEIPTSVIARNRRALT
jgi:hypothetical protein